MLWRFSLYGFLKNQRYFEPFLILALRSLDLSFFLIGMLIAFREVMVNVLEIPSGAVADVWGRRRAMMFSFTAYIISFLLFGTVISWADASAPSRGYLLSLLAIGMGCFAVGDAFRTGTHKAMIFAWLRREGRMDERTRVYGYTRSWSKIGSAVSVVLAGVVVFLTGNYAHIFFLSAIPYLIGLLNFCGYPAALDGAGDSATSLREVWRHLKSALGNVTRTPALRRLVAESMGFEGFFKATKDYLQPILQATALPLMAYYFADFALEDSQKAAVLIGPVYLILYLLSAVASRQAHRLVEYFLSEERAARMLWGSTAVLFAGLVPVMVYDWQWGMIGGFLLLSILQNFWRPVLISRFDAHTQEHQGATVLSIESQAKSIATMLLAPAIGFAVDVVGTRNLGGAYWPIGAVGFMIAGGFWLTAKQKNKIK